MTKYRLLHVPSGEFREIELKDILENMCDNGNCPASITEGGGDDCDKCPWSTYNEFSDIEYDLEKIKE